MDDLGGDMDRTLGESSRSTRRGAAIPGGERSSAVWPVRSTCPGRRGDHRESIGDDPSPAGGEPRWGLPPVFLASPIGVISNQGGASSRFLRALARGTDAADGGKFLEIRSVGGPSAGRTRIYLSEFIAKVVEYLPLRIERADLSGDAFTVLNGDRPDNRLDERNLGRNQ